MKTGNTYKEGQTRTMTTGTREGGKDRTETRDEDMAETAPEIRTTERDGVERLEGRHQEQNKNLIDRETEITDEKGSARVQ